MKVAEIWRYPIKGLGGYQSQQAKVLESGLEHDRRFMLIDKNGKFISQRSHKSMAKLAVEQTIDGLKVTQKDTPHNQLLINDINDITSNLTSAKVWNSTVEAHVLKKEINEWFSTFLNDNVRLVKQATFANRKRWINGKKVGISFADGYPILFLSKSSVKDLSLRMGQEVDLRQFRANIIIEDCAPYQEDELSTFQIRTTSFKMVKPCKRCPVIDIHQDTGESHQKVVKALLQYRKSGNAVIFGMNAAIKQEGIIKLHDTLKIN